MENIRTHTYSSIHFWLRTNYGHANKCENSLCLKKSNKFQWAKLKDKKYDYNRENFIMLCGKCHYYYDEKYNFRKSKAKSK